ncbi:MAG: transposase [Deltaproteobacteria bacterium]|nr:transposase [Deltaproteobacteria bacterium]
MTTCASAVQRRAYRRHRPEQTVLHAIVQRASKEGTDGDADADAPAGMGRSSVALHGFNLHAAVRVGADDDVARERLVRYCARPPFALERLSVLPDGRIAYRIKQSRKNATHRILSPIELLARIAALIPPPRHPFLRYHGVLGPSSRWRSLIVPREPDADSADSTARTTHAPHDHAHRTRDVAPLLPATRAPDARASASSPRPTTPSASPVPRARPPTASIVSMARSPATDTARRSRAAFAVLAPAHLARVAATATCRRGPTGSSGANCRRSIASSFARSSAGCSGARARPAAAPEQ